jgi:hypothetical protein
MKKLMKYFETRLGIQTAEGSLRENMITFGTLKEWMWILLLLFSYLVFFPHEHFFELYLSWVICCHLTCICFTLCVFVVPFVYLFYYVCVLLFLLWMSDCWLEVSIRKVLQSATSTQVFLGFPVSTSECWDG